MNREELISLTEDSYVPYQKWNNRDSYINQVNITTIYKLLSAGVDYDISIEKDTVRLIFKNMTKEQYEDTDKYNLNIDSLDSYFEEFGYESEMFEAYCDLNRLDKNQWKYINYKEEDIIEVYTGYLSGYLPTRERLEKADGEDWY